MKPLLTPEDISRETGIPVETIRAWIRQKKLPAYKPGKHYLVKREDWEKFLEESRTDKDEER